MSRVVVVGASEHAKYTIDILGRQGGSTVVGLVDDRDVGTDLAGCPVLGRIDDLPALVEQSDIDAAIIGIGDNWSRSRVVRRVEALCPVLGFATAIHPSAQIGSRTIIGPGTVIMAGVVINNDCVVGEHAFLATSCSLDHDSVLGAFASLSPNVATGGMVRIGDCSAIGISASVLHGMTIGEHSVVGAGSVVLHDVPDHVVVYGTPARVVRTRTEGDRYL